MAGLLTGALLCAGLSAGTARAGEPADTDHSDRLYASVATGKTRLLGLGNYGDTASSVRAELGWGATPTLGLTLVLEGSHHNVQHYSLQQDDRGIVVSGDFGLGQLGIAGRWGATTGTLQPALRLALGAAAWRSPVDEDFWSQLFPDRYMANTTDGLGAWTSVGGELGIEVSPGGPRCWCMASVDLEVELMDGVASAPIPARRAEDGRQDEKQGHPEVQDEVPRAELGGLRKVSAMPG